MMTECRICGRLFNARLSTCVTCSPECREINNKRLHHRWYELNRETICAQRKARYACIRKPHICRLCGTPTPDGHHYHDECVVNDAIAAIREGVVLQRDSRVIRARNVFGYSIRELRELSEEGDYVD